MNKKLKFSISAFILMIIFVISSSGCGINSKQKTNDKQETTLYEKIQTSLTGLENFNADATVRYISNNGSSVYTTKQYGKASGEYRIDVVGPDEVKGNITIFDGNVICQYNENMPSRVAIGKNESSERYEILLTSFIKNYTAQTQETVSVANIDQDQDATVLGATIVGTDPYISTEKLWVDNKSLKPIQLIVYGEDGKERIVVTYHNVEYNTKLDSNLFLIKQ